MEFPVPAYTTFTIPTGATTGARIVFNENGSGTIRVYNSSNVLVDEIGGSFGDMISYATGLTVSVALSSGAVKFGTAPGFTNAGQLVGDLILGGGLQLSTGTGDTNHIDGLDIVYRAGLSGTVSGNANAPRMIVGDHSLTSPADIWVTGAIIKAKVSNQTLETWQTPSYKANWVVGSSINGLGGPALRYRLMPDDTLWIYGLAHANAGAGTTMFTLPSGYYPTTKGSSNMGLANTTPVNYAINTVNGDFIVNVATAGADYLVDVRIPMQNIS